MLIIQNIIAQLLQSNRCEIDSEDSALYLNITGSNKAKLMLEMTPGFHTQNFVSEILDLTEKKDKNQQQNFDWLEKYSKGKFCTNSTHLLLSKNSVEIYWIFLPLRFHVKTILTNLESQVDEITWTTDKSPINIKVSNPA